MTDLSLPVTSVAALLNGALMVALTIRVIVLRRKLGAVMGDKGDRVLAKAIRGHANAAEQIPLALILLGLSELQGASPLLLALLAVLLTAGRGMHGAYFAWHGLHWRFRVYGMLLTFTALGGLLLTLLVTLLA